MFVSSRVHLGTDVSVFVTLRCAAEGEGSGQAGRDCRLAVKLLPVDPVKRLLVLDQKVALREIGAYRFLSSDIVTDLCSRHGVQVPLPRVIYAEASPDAMTLVLDDLREEYEVVCPKEGLGLTRVRTMLEAIAVVHAVGRVCIMKRGVNSIQQYLPDVSGGDEFLNGYVRSGLAHLASLSFTDSMKKLLINLIPVAHRLGVVPAAARTVPDTLLHGDYWAGQVMVGRHEQDRAKIIDWQFSRVGNPFVDVVTLLVMSAAPTVLRHHLHEAVKSYWRSYTATLTACCVPSAGETLGEAETTMRGVEAAVAAVEASWHLGLRMFLASVQTHLSHGRVTSDRVAHVLDLLHNKGVLAAVVEDSPGKC